jgi:hypothetical protein
MSHRIGCPRGDGTQDDLDEDGKTTNRFYGLKLSHFLDEDDNKREFSFEK